MRWEDRLRRLSPRARRMLWSIVADMLPLCVYVARRMGRDEDAAYDLGIPIIMRCALGCKEGQDLANYVRRSLERRLLQRPVLLPRVPEDTVKRDVSQDVYNLLEGLNEQDAMLLRLHYIGGYTVVELARLLGVSRSTAWRYLRDAHARARQG